MEPGRVTATRFVTLARNALLLALPLAAPAGALPRFGGTAAPGCSGCHVSVPALNAAGMRFLREGYHAGGAHGAAGAEVRGAGVSVLADLGAAHTWSDTVLAGGGREARTAGGFREPVLGLVSAGRPADRVSFIVHATLDSADGAVRAPVAAVQFGDPGPGRALALRAGAFDAGLPFLSSSRRLTRADYLAPVTVDARGLEVAGAWRDWSGALGRMNSARSGAGEPRGFDRLEDTYARLVRTFGGQVVGARMLFDRQDSDISWHAWVQRLQFQAGALLGGGRAWFVPAYTLDRFDDRPAAGIHQRRQYVTPETIALLGARNEWTWCARAEHEHTTPTRLSPGEDRDLEVTALARELSPRVRAGLEISHVGSGPGGPRATSVSATVRLAY